MRELRPESSTYTVERLVGVGQMATVFKAIRRDSRGHCLQPVALKILKNRIDVQSLRLQFESLARVNSPHCVRALGWENLPEGSALVLEWIDGVSLFELAKFEHLSTAVVEEVIHQTADGLRALSDAGIHHGDLSPANILIDGTGGVRIVDFGPIHDADAASIRGTMAYLAPEIWEGARTSTSADLFALGLIALDLENGGFFSSNDAEENRRRAFAHAGGGSALLKKDPALRTFPADTRSEPERAAARSALAVMVRRRIENQPRSIETAVLRASAPRSPVLLRLAALVTALLATTAVAVNAEAPPVSAGDVQPRSASITARSQDWRELNLNGRIVGYAPLEIPGLEPGRHHLSWKTRSGAGSEYLILKPGERLIITDHDWGDSDAMRNH